MTTVLELACALTHAIMADFTRKFFMFTAQCKLTNWDFEMNNKGSLLQAFPNLVPSNFPFQKGERREKALASAGHVVILNIHCGTKNHGLA